MAAIIEELTIEAGPQRVVDALTRADEIARWWAYEARVKPEVGSLEEFRFRRGAFVMQLEVAELEQDRKVCWVSRQVPPQWAGTSMTWQLEPASNGTALLFTQDGFTQLDERTGKAWVYLPFQSEILPGNGQRYPRHPSRLLMRLASLCEREGGLPQSRLVFLTHQRRGGKPCISRIGGGPHW